MFKNAFKLEINKTIKAHANAKGVRENTGSAMIPCPILSDFGIQAEQAKDDKGEVVVENGLPVYENATYQWLMDAIQAAVSVKSRNKFDAATGKLKPGMEIPTDFETLTATSARTGEALVLRREARASFENYLRSLNKKDSVVNALGELFWNSAKILGTVGEKPLEAITHYSQRWVATLDEAQKTRFAPKLDELTESINNAHAGEEDLMAEGDEKAAA